MSIKNNRGALTLDFIFAMVLVGGMTAALFTLSLTLTVAEVGQYISFASARNYFAAHINKDAQEKSGEQKFLQLMQVKAFKNLYKGDWFSLTYMGSKDFAGTMPQAEARDVYSGTRLQFVSKVLKFEIPFYGSTGNSDSGFKSTISSYIGREPSFEETLLFEQMRWEYIKRLGYSSLPSQSKPKVVTDNG